MTTATLSIANTNRRTADITARLFRENGGAYLELVRNYEMFDEVQADSLRDAARIAIEKGATFFGIFDSNGELERTFDLEHAKEWVNA